MSTDHLDDDGTEIVRERIGRHIDSLEDRIIIKEVEVSFEQGVAVQTGQGSDPQAWLSWSKNDGKTFGNEIARSTGLIGEYDARCVWRFLGESRDWLFRLRVSDPVKWIVQGAGAKARTRPTRVQGPG